MVLAAIIASKEASVIGDYNKSRLNETPHTKVGWTEGYYQCTFVPSLLFQYRWSFAEPWENSDLLHCANHLLKIFQLKTENKTIWWHSVKLQILKAKQENQHLAKKTISHVEMLKSHSYTWKAQAKKTWFFSLCNILYCSLT